MTEPQALGILYDWLFPPDDLVEVETVELARLLHGYIEKWRSERPSTRGRFTSGERGSDCDPLGAYEALAFHTGVPEGVIRKLDSARRPPVVPYDTADRLVQIIGEPVMFYDGTLTIISRASSPALSRPVAT